MVSKRQLFIGTLLAAFYSLLTWNALSPGWWLLGLGQVLAASLYLFRKAPISIEWVALRFERKSYSTKAKVLSCVLMLVLVLTIEQLWFHLLCLTLCLVWILGVSRIPIAFYLSALRIPLVFIALSGIVFLFDVSAEPIGVLNWPWFHQYIVVTTSARMDTSLRLIKIIASYHCLLALIVTTPMRKILHLIESLHLPVVSNLMYFIYRDIDLLSRILSSLQQAGRLRQGYSSYQRSFRTMKLAASQLLIRGISHSRLHYQALQCRLYEHELKLLHPDESTKKDRVLYGLVIILLIVGVFHAYLV